jgi:Fe2+ or Zn2+ uptake regulation protein
MNKQQIDNQDFFRKNAMKLTPQRQIIYTFLTGNRQHPSATDVYRELKPANPSLSFDTVNRTMASFSQKGLIKEISGRGKAKRYDSVTKDHHHFFCLKCGRVFDFDNDILKKFDSKILKKFGKVLNASLSIEGVCKDCLKKIK